MRVRVLVGGAATCVALLAGGAVLAGAAAATVPTEGSGGSGLGPGTVVVADLEVPVLATFELRGRQDDEGPQVRGVVHGVQRVEGGTALYYSLGATGDEDVYGFQIFPQAAAVRDVGTAWDVRLVDAANLRAYRPLRTDDGLAVVKDEVFDGRSGQLHVGWAVFPELPDGVDAVQVVMPNGTVAGEVEVRDGALGPVVDADTVRPGEGWPALPDAAVLATADPDEVSYVLTRRSSDLEQEVTVEESPEQVGVSLDASVAFAFDSADLTADAQARLAQVAADIAARGTGEVVVTGHTDSDGDAAYNQSLSEQRAQAVVAALAPGPGSAVTFTAVGRGEDEPVADNGTEEGKKANRRVTVVYSVEGDR